MAGHDRQFGEQCRHVRLRNDELYSHRGVVHRDDGVDAGEVGRAVVSCRGILPRQECERDIVRRGWHAIVPREAGQQGERQHVSAFTPHPAPRIVRFEGKRRVVPHERDEQRVPLHLPRQWMHRDERIRGLEVRTRRHDDDARAALRCDARRDEQQGTSGQCDTQR